MKLTSIKKIEKEPVYDITVENRHTFVTNGGIITHNSFIPTTIVSGGQGATYSSQNIFIIGRRQLKDGKDLAGYEFVLNIEKSRGAKEKSKLPFAVTFDGGINRLAGLFDIALDLGFIVMPTSGYYSRVLNGTREESKHRRKAVEYDEAFWKPILDDPKFDKAIQNKFKLVKDTSTEDDVNLNEDIEV